MTATDDLGSHGDITLERSDNIGSLLFLVPADGSVEHKNTDDDTQINPITQTCCKKDCKFHDCKVRVSVIAKTLLLSNGGLMIGCRELRASGIAGKARLAQGAARCSL